MKCEWECRYGSKKLGVRPKELKRAMREVGDKAEAVYWVQCDASGKQLNHFPQCSLSWKTPAA